MKDFSNLRVVGPGELRAEAKELLRPGELVECIDGSRQRLPRYFLEVPTWAMAKSTRLSPHFSLAELMLVDCREHPELLHCWPHYVPATVLIFASYLELLRRKVGISIYLAANGGYRTPAHRLDPLPTPHSWGCAADIYRVGNTFLNNEESIQKNARIVAEIRPELTPETAGTDDHLHLDLGYLTWAPAGCGDD